MSSPFTCTVARTDLLDALTCAARVADKKITIPVFGSVLLSAERAGLQWWATDGTIWRSGVIPAAQATGSGVIPAAQALAVVKACDAAEIYLATAKSFIAVKAGAYKAKLPALPREDYPTLPDIAASASFSVISSGSLRTMLARVSPAILSGSLELCGALFRIADGELLCVSTDRHQLAKIGRPLDRAVMSDDSVVSHRLIQELARLAAEDGEIEFSLTETRQVFRRGHDVLIGPPLSAKFPAFERVIPKAGKTTLRMARGAMLDALNRVALVADDPQRNVLFSVAKDAVTLSAQSARLGEASETLPASITGPALTFRLNPDYARNFLNVSDADEIACEAEDDGRPVVFRAAVEKDDAYVIMPVRI